MHRRLTEFSSLALIFTVVAISEFSSPALLAQDAPNESTFPCSLDSPNRVKITLSGETHDNPIADADSDYQYKLASEGKQYVGAEGLFVNESSTTPGVFGFDDPFTYGLGSLLKLNDFLSEAIMRGDQDEIIKLKINLVNNLVRIPFLHEAWLSLRSSRPFSDPREERFAAAIDLVWNKDSSQPQVVNDFRSGMLTTSLQEEVSFRSLVRDFGLAYVSMAQSKKYKVTMKVPESISLAIDAFSGKNSLPARDRLAIQWRDIFLAENIAELYCKALRDKKDLIVIMGRDHQHELKLMLESMSNHRLKVGLRDSMSDFQEVVSTVGAPDGIIKQQKLPCSTEAKLADRKSFSDEIKPSCGDHCQLLSIRVMEHHDERGVRKYVFLNDELGQLAIWGWSSNQNILDRGEIYNKLVGDEWCIAFTPLSQAELNRMIGHAAKLKKIDLEFNGILHRGPCSANEKP